MEKAEVLYYLWSENKGADQLWSYCTSDLWLCFSRMQTVGFLVQRLKYKEGDKVYIYCLLQGKHTLKSLMIISRTA